MSLYSPVGHASVTLRHDVRLQGFRDNGLGKLREALAHRHGEVSGLQPVLQAAISNGLSLDPFSIGQDGWTTSEVDVGRGEIVELSW
jgi:hypothetical protein